MLLAALLALSRQAAIDFRDGLVIGRTAVGGRVPVVLDAINGKMVAGEPVSPRAGDALKLPSGQDGIWKGTTAGSDGWFSGQELEGAGYLYSTVDSPEERTMLLEAVGDNFVYVNGVPRTGDPYGYGYLRLPVRLRKGTNEFLFSVGRGRLKARLLEPSAPMQLDVADATMPDVIPTDKGTLFGAVVVENNTDRDVTGLTIDCAAAGKDIRTTLPSIPAYGVRKVRFDFPAGAKDLDLVLLRDGKPVHSAKVQVRQRKATETYKRTFESSIDGSVQYYCVNPSSKPDKTNALILSVHGASVEATSQADAYTSKPWATLVAATNRRPYGFDWEDWGRWDALEVLAHAGARIPHDSSRVVLTGHSMGGHGTWSIGSLYPDRFGAIAPSAGWISFWSYAGGWEPRNPTAPEALLRRSMSPSDTLARITNLYAQKVYILHGDADDNVPVEQARTMRNVLAKLGIDFGYHEEKGAGHWWGNQCVDYPDLMATLESARISDFANVDFTTPDPAVSAKCGWLRIDQQERPRIVSHVAGDLETLKTENVRALTILKRLPSLTLDGTKFSSVAEGATFIKTPEGWRAGELPKTSRHVGLMGPLKQAFAHKFVLVYGTAGTSDESRWARAKARYDAETFYYRGNGSVEIVSDEQFLKDGFPGRNVIVYGNAATNRAWRRLLADAPVRVGRGVVRVGDHTLNGEGNAAAFVYPSEGRLVAGIGGAGLAGMRLTDRLPIFTSGTAYPDWVVLGSEAATLGTKGILGAGYFSPAWTLEGGEAAWK